MARKSKSSLLGDVLDLACSISWKVSLPIAIIAYFGIHHLSEIELVHATEARAAINNVPMQLLVLVAGFMQYVVPILFLVGAVTSWLRGNRRKKLLERQTGLQSIRNMSWQEFEVLVGEVYRRQGYSVRETGGGGADGGIDLMLSKGGRQSVVQCKRWKTTSISVSLVRELYGVMTGVKANSCIFVTSGSYTTEAKLFAQGKPITLVDGEELFRLVSSVKTEFNSPPDEESNLIESDTPSKIRASSSKRACPACGGTMIKRAVKNGSNAGAVFLGCSNYPKCRCTINC